MHQRLNPLLIDAIACIARAHLTAALTLSGVVAIAGAVVSWQPLAHATTIKANTETGQPLTRADCVRAGLAWDDNRNVCGYAATAETKNEAYWQRQYCAGMEIEKKLFTGGRVDCFNEEYAIEVDWAQKWAEAVGRHSTMLALRIESPVSSCYANSPKVRSRGCAEVLSIGLNTRSSL